MEILERSGFAAVLPLVPPASEAGHMTFVHTVLEGTMPGTVFVDDPAAPASAIVLNDCGFHTVLGAPPDAEGLGALLEQVSAACSEEPGLLVDATGSWTTVLEPLLGAPFGRKEYHPPLVAPESPPLLGGFRLEPLTAEIADRFEGAVDPWVVRIWGGRDAFAERTYGFAVLAPDGSLASFCTVCGLGGGEAEIEIGTNEAFRERGLARTAAVAFIAESASRGLTPAWTCQSDNEPSWRLANSLGFREFRTVNCFTFDRGFTA